MDIYCTKCGEPWDIDCLHDPAEYDLTLRGRTIIECGGCLGVDIKSRPAVALAAEALGDLMPDDPDGVAAMIEDADAWGLL